MDRVGWGMPMWESIWDRLVVCSATGAGQPYQPYRGTLRGSVTGVEGDNLRAATLIHWPSGWWSAANGGRGPQPAVSFGMSSIGPPWRPGSTRLGGGLSHSRGMGSRGRFFACECKSLHLRLGGLGCLSASVVGGENKKKGKYTKKMGGVRIDLRIW